MTEGECHKCHRVMSKAKLFWRRSPLQEPILLCHLCIQELGRTTIRIQTQRAGKDGA